MNLCFSNLVLDCFPCRLCQPRKFAEANLKLFYAWGAVAAVEAGGKSKKFGGKLEVQKIKKNAEAGLNYFFFGSSRSRRRKVGKVEN